MGNNKIDLRAEALSVLLICEPADKVTATQQLYAQCEQGEFFISEIELDVPAVPGRPVKPELVSPRDLPRRRNNQQTGHATLIHAITHIEFNAINLGLDAVARFSKMPQQFYLDWMRVAFEESHHFQLLREHLQSLSFDYGSFPAHNGMWEMAQKTHHDVLTRMALVPRVLEARGLDVTPSMMQKLEKSGDHRAVEILQLILREEIGHVAIGTRWFNYLCEQQGIDPLSTFEKLLNIYFNGELRGPFHTEARKKAGFTDAEMAMLEAR